MKKYTVEGGIARVGLGEVVGLSEEQVAARSHNLERMTTKGKLVTCRAKVPLEFKSGEQISLPADPPKSMMAILVAEDDAKPKGKTKPKGNAGEESKPADDEPSGDGGDGDPDDDLPPLDDLQN